MGGLECVVTGGGGGPGPVVVLLHGFGAPGDDLVPLAHCLDVPRSVHFVFPAAPTPMAFGGRAWWMIDMEELEAEILSQKRRDRSHEVPEGLAPARAQMDALLDDVTAELGGPIVLGGFSQGAMLATDVALRSTRPLSGLLLLSGTLLAADEWRPLAPARRGLRVLQSHGTGDPLLPFEAAERLRDLLRDGGLAVDFLSFPGGHEIPPRVIEQMSRFLSSFH